MSFDQIERSNYDGKPILLYEFVYGNIIWRYSGGQKDVTLNGVLYQAISVSHEGYSMSGSPSDDNVNISISTQAAVAKLFNGTPPSRSVQASIRTLHFGDAEAPVVWSGIIKSMRRVSNLEAQLNCNSMLSTLNRNGLRLSWQRGCPHALYDNQCRVNPDEHGVAVQVSELDGLKLTSPSLGWYGVFPNWFGGGYISFTGPHGNLELRPIERHQMSSLFLMSPPDGISVGSWITVYPGCDRTSATCLVRFDNLPNYGGFPHLPTKSPFDGDPVF